MLRTMIVSCGEALVDLVPHAVAGGGPMNVAVAAARLGAPSAFVGCVSNDAHGRLIWDHLLSNGVNTDACARSDAPTARAIIEHTPKLVFRFEGDNTADTALESVDLTVLGEQTHILHGGTLGLFRGRTAETLATLVEGHDGIVSLDPNIRPQIIDDRDRWDHFHQRWLARTDIYKGSDEDLEWIWPDRSAEASAEALLESGVCVVVLTRGAEGLTVITSEGASVVTAPPVDVVDTVGAGDTTVAALLTCVLEHGATDPVTLAKVAPADWVRFGERAVDAAAITCSRPGADPPYRSELDW